MSTRRVVLVLAGIVFLAASLIYVSFNPLLITPVLEIDDSGVPAAVKNAVTAPGPPHIDRTHPDYPSGQVVTLRVATQDYPRNPAVEPSMMAQFFSSYCGQMNYWVNNSLGAFNPFVGFSSPWIDLDGNIADYGNFEDGAAFKIAAIENSNINWNLVDLDHDNVITRSEAVLLFLVPWYDTSTQYSRRASTRAFSGDVVTDYGDFRFENVRAITYTTKAFSEPDYTVDPLRDPSVYAHELAHALFDLPDRYRAGSANGFTGQYDLMTADRTWELLPAYDRVKLGWIQPKVLTPGDFGFFEFHPSNFSPEIVALIDPAKPQEYWLVEYRTNTSGLLSCPYDSGLPETGFAVWWVRENAFPVSSAWAGYDDVRLVDASLPDQDPDGGGYVLDSNNVPFVASSPGYYSPQSGAFFEPVPGVAMRDLYYSDGTQSPFSFRIVSADGSSARIWIAGSP